MSFIENFKDATIGFSGYSRLARDRSSAFGFMALLLFISVAVAGAVTTVHTQRLMTLVAQEIQRGPEFGLKDGEFFFDGEMPYRTSAGGIMTLVVDTTGQTGPDVLKGEPPSSLLVTRTAVYQVDPFGVVRENPFSMLPVDFNRADVVELLERIHLWVPAIYLGVYVLQLGFKALDAAILGSLAAAYGSGTLRRKVPMALGFKLALYAMSLPTVLQWVFPYFRSYTLRGFLLWWGLSLIYLLQGLKACADAGVLEPVHTDSDAS